MGKRRVAECCTGGTYSDHFKALVCKEDSFRTEITQTVFSPVTSTLSTVPAAQECHLYLYDVITDMTVINTNSNGYSSHELQVNTAGRAAFTSTSIERTASKTSLFRHEWRRINFWSFPTVSIWLKIVMQFVQCLLSVKSSLSTPLTFWHRNFFLNFSTRVYKMWIIQEPNTVELWNKLHFEGKKTESIYHV